MNLDERMAALAAAIEAADGRVSDADLEPARAVVQRSRERSAVGAELTVVSLGGATGSGKSSLFNAVTGIDIAGIGVRRPTTTWTLACSWGGADAGPLLDWIGIPPRQRLSPSGLINLRSRHEDMFSGLVLLDLPDHDSFFDHHHDEVAHVVDRSDLFVWVLDPQKYADAALHDQYLRPRSRHSGNTIVVLNQIDRLGDDDRQLALADVRRLLDEAGLESTPLIATSTKSGEGIDDLRARIAEHVATTNAWSDRLEADLRAVAQTLSAVTGNGAARGLTPDDRQELLDALEKCAGAPQIVDAVETSAMRQLRLDTGWPLLSWWYRLRKDPLASVGLLRSVRDVVTESLPTGAQSTSVQSSGADVAVRAIADRGSEGMPAPWRRVVLDATRRGDEHGARAAIDVLDGAVAKVDVTDHGSASWVVVWRVLQWLCAAALVVGALWSVVLVVSSVTALDVPAASTFGMPLPFLMLLGGIAGGIVLTVLSGRFAAVAARRRAAAVGTELTAAVASTIDEDFWPPINAELDRWSSYVSNVSAAAR